MTPSIDDTSRSAALGLNAHLSEDHCRQVLQELVRVPSPQTDLLEAEPLLRRFIDEAVAPRLAAMGIDRIRRDPMGNLIADIGPDQNGRSMMFVSNAMNQPQATMTNAYDGEIRDGADYDLPGKVVLGKGASEQKATMAAMLCAIEALMAAGCPIKGRVTFLCCVSGETGRHDAIRSVVEGQDVRADLAVLGGGSLRLSLGNRGRVDVFVTIHGNPCHSSRPVDGCDAVTGALEMIRQIRAHCDITPSHPDLGSPTVAITHIRSFPESTHTIQDRVELTVDRRLLPGEAPAKALSEIQAAADATMATPDPASGRNWRVEVSPGPFMYPSLTPADGAAVRLLQESAQSALGRTMETFYSSSAFDQGYLYHEGIEAINWGPGEYQFAHTDLDMASVARTTDAARVYAEMMLRYLE